MEEFSGAPPIFYLEEFMGEKSFYGDRDKGSQMPAWYCDRQIRELKESVYKKERSLEHELVPRDKIGAYKEQLKREKVRLSELEASKPKFTAPELDRLAKGAGSIGAKIKESLPSRGEVMKGLADSHEEMEKDLEPCIKLGDEEVELAKMANVELNKKGEVSRNDATRIWQLSNKILGEKTNVEVLRRD
jgi:hypothetical protein